jgi:hypothetical protein
MEEVYPARHTVFLKKVKAFHPLQPHGRTKKNDAHVTLLGF